MMTKTTSNVSVIITAAGSSSRFGGDCKKEYLPYKNGTVLSASIKAFLNLNEKLDFGKKNGVNNFFISTVIVTSPKNQNSFMKELILSDSELVEKLPNVRLEVIEGSSSRQESVFNAIESINEFSDIVLIHDGARPFVSESLIRTIIENTITYGASIPSLIPTDTFKIVDENNFVTSSLERKNLRAVQTPQGFNFQKLKCAYCNIEKKSGRSSLSSFTDDAEIWSFFYDGIKIVEGEKSNVKITYHSDINLLKSENKEKMIRVGLGYDLHRLSEGRKLLLGGVEIDFEKGEVAHSDGDVLLHAITDAILGACGLGDIGSYFPPEDPKWKDADSSILLKTVMQDVRKNGFEIENLDCVIKLEKPKFFPYRDKVINSIASILEVSSDRVFVKAKTGEKLFPVGTSEAVEAEVVALLSKNIS